MIGQAYGTKEIEFSVDVLETKTLILNLNFIGKIDSRSISKYSVSFVAI